MAKETLGTNTKVSPRYVTNLTSVPGCASLVFVRTTPIDNAIAELHRYQQIADQKQMDEYQQNQARMRGLLEKTEAGDIEWETSVTNLEGEKFYAKTPAGMLRIRISGGGLMRLYVTIDEVDYCEDDADSYDEWPLLNAIREHRQRLLDTLLEIDS